MKKMVSFFDICFACFLRYHFGLKTTFSKASFSASLNFSVIDKKCLFSKFHRLLQQNHFAAATDTQPDSGKLGVLRTLKPATFGTFYRMQDMKLCSGLINNFTDLKEEKISDLGL